MRKLRSTNVAVLIVLEMNEIEYFQVRINIYNQIEIETFSNDI